MERVRVLDGVVETSLRILCLLNIVGDNLDKDRLVAYDYFSLYYHDVDANACNLISGMPVWRAIFCFA